MHPLPLRFLSHASGLGSRSSPLSAVRIPGRNSFPIPPHPLGSWSHRSFTVSTARLTVTPVQQLKRIRELQERVGATSSKTEKGRIISEYADLRDLLEHVYDPLHRTHLSSASLTTYLDAQRPINVDKNTLPPDISRLFDILSSRTVTGNAAKSLVGAFLREHKIITGNPEVDNNPLLDVFMRLLDRNLVAGFGARTLSTVQWAAPAADKGTKRVSANPGVSPSAGKTKATPAKENGKTASIPASKSTATPPTPTPTPVPSTLTPRRSLQAFSCALGKTVLPPFGPLFKGTDKWYASRKLDGVRCITFLDFLVPSPSYGSPESSPKLVNTRFLSRTGRDFTALDNLIPQLSSIEGYPGLADLLAQDPLVVEKHPHGEIKRLVLDGEVCLMVPSSSSPDTSSTSSTSSSSDLWQDHGLIEDFPRTVSEIRRMNHTIERPAYYLFDLLSFAEFNAKKSLKSPLGKTFSKRLEDLQSVAEWVKGQLTAGDYLAVKALGQVSVHKAEEVEGMVEVAAREGWEGLVLRVDKGYKGKRSPDVRKFKQWQDAEYTVTGLDISRQRLALNGVFSEHEAVAALHIMHKGCKVAVGSGLSAGQRVGWAKNPDLIVGKEITVEYFSESESLGREGMSLRFPRIKTVWEGQGRDV